jgi:GTP-binding protein EngB required for normal cell division
MKEEIDIKEETKKMEESLFENNLEVFEVNNYNIIIIGDSRSGKSTFIKLIRNINHCIESEVFSGTKNPESEMILLKYKGIFRSIVIIDTPGFNEIGSESSKSNANLKSLITTFVKKDITKIHLVLVAINGSSGVNKFQIDSINNTLKFLGKNLSKNTALLITHFDTKDEEEQNNFIKKFYENKEVEFIRKMCRAGYLFTGAIDKTMHKNIKIRDEFILLQNKRISKFLDLLTSTTPESLNNELSKTANTLFSVSESVVKDYLLLKELAPEIKSLNSQVEKKRIKLSSLVKEREDLGKKYDKIIERCSIIGTDQFKIPDFDEKIEEDLKNYNKISDNIRENALDCLNKQDILVSMLNDISHTIDMIEYTDDE